MVEVKCCAELQVVIAVLLAGWNDHFHEIIPMTRFAPFLE